MQSNIYLYHICATTWIVSAPQKVTLFSYIVFNVLIGIAVFFRVGSVKQIVNSNTFTKVKYVLGLHR